MVRSPLHGLDPVWHACRVLIIDRDPASRHALAALLREFGVDANQIQQAPRIAQARAWLEAQTFDVVLCDYHFGPDEMNGQDLLDDLRLCHLLPLTTVFVMVTAEASYTKVAEAAESALDSYLLKPFTPQSLGQRLALARHRKLTLGPIYKAIESGQHELAARLCQSRYQSKQMYWLYAARIGAELLLRLNRYREAQDLFVSVQTHKPAPWAQLGIARTHVETGFLETALEVIDQLIADQPSFVDAYDLLGHTRLQQGQWRAALQACAKAVELTPSSISRLQKLGKIAYYLDEFPLATEALQSASQLGLASKSFDPQSLVLLALMQYAAGQGQALEQTRDLMLGIATQKAAAPSLQRQMRAIQILLSLQQRQVLTTMRLLKETSNELSAPDFDMEAAATLVRLLSLTERAGLELPDAGLWIESLARRFSTSKSHCEFLVQACAHLPALEALIHRAYLEIGGMAEQALQEVSTHTPTQATQNLIAQGQHTLNVKLLKLAQVLLQRHQQEIVGHADLLKIVTRLRERYLEPILPMVACRPGDRAPGGLALRTDFDHLDTLPPPHLIKSPTPSGYLTQST